MTSIGYATLQIIPSLEGVSDAVNKQLGFLPKTGKDAGKSLGASLAAGVDAAAKKVEQAASKVEAARKKEADATGKAKVAEAQLQALRDRGVTDAGRLAAATEKVAAAQRNVTQATRVSTNAAGVLKRAQSDLGKAQKDLDGSDDRVGRSSKSLGALSSAWSSMGASAAAAGGPIGIGVAAMTAAVGAAALLGTALYNLGGTFDETFDGIAIKTGASGPQLEALQQSVKNLGRTVPLSIGEIGNVVAEVSRGLHLTGPELDNMSKSVANLGRLTGESVDVRGLGKAFRSFGVDAKDQQKTLDSLFGAYQQTGIPVNELVASVTKGGPALRQFGLDFGQSAALVSTFEQAGLDADKSIAGMTKALAALAKEQGTTGPEALRQTVTQIKDLTKAGRDADAMNLTNKIFGAKGGVGFFEAIKSGALDLEALQNSLANTGASINDTASRTDDFEQKWQTFKNTAAVALEPLASSLFSFVNDGLGSLASWVTQHQPEIIGFFGATGQAVIFMGELILRMAAGGVEALSYLVGGIGNLAGSALKAQAAMQDLVGDDAGARATREMSESMFSWGENMRGLSTGLEGAANSLAGLRNSIGASAEQMANAAKLTVALGDATASLPDGKTITISENTPEVREKLAGIGIQVQELPDKTVTVTANTAEGQRILDAWRNGAQSPVTVPVYADMTQAQQQIAKLTALTAAGAPGLAGLAAIPQRGSFDLGGYTGDLPFKQIAGVVHGSEFVIQATSQESIERDHPGLLDHMNATGKLPGYENGGKVGGRPQGTAEGLNPGADFLRTLVMKTWPQITRIGGRRGEDGYGEHSSGNAIDIMIDNYDTPAGQALGNAVLATLQQNGPAFDVNGIIWRQTSYGYGGSLTAGKPMPDRGSPTQNHFDHLHVILGKGRGTGAAAVPAPTGLVSAATPNVAASPAPNLAPAVSPDLSSGSSGAGQSISIPSSISGLSSWGFDSMASGAKSEPGNRDPAAYFPKAASAAIGGQVSSALGVLGIPDTPQWLSGISSYLGTIQVGGKSILGGGNLFGGGDTGAMHAGSGAAPGPTDWISGSAAATAQPVAATPTSQVTYNIAARDTEDAFIRAQRQERERAAAKLSRY